MGAYRTYVFWGISAAVLLLAFLLFVAIGWPGSPNSCLNIVHGKVVSDSCYCEAYDFSKILHHAPGVRQPVNTWFNLYSLITSLIVATGIYLSRVQLDNGGTAVNLISSNNPIADMYVFAVLFLGLGSMWFHASLTEAVSWFDGLSMYTYAGFLVFFTIRRHWSDDWFINGDLFFWISYPVTVVGFTLLGQFVNTHLSSAPTSLFLIGILVIAYIVLEFTLGWVNGFSFNGPAPVFWICGAVAMALAVLFWALSQTGGPMCHPTSAFQPHGLLWHPLAGVMATFMYFYWRAENRT